jgi:tRNA pseudouridine55 synthase
MDARADRQGAAAPHGLLIINKEAGPTSHDIVQRVRRVLATRQVGHAGTLDPFARGVLAICVGDATRLVEYVMRGTKVYHAEVLFGIETETDDTTGRVTKHVPMTVDEDTLRAVLSRFSGDLDQIPPAYSAVKVDGERMHRAARRGETLAAAPRRVHIESIELLAFSRDPHPHAQIRVTCGSGTYMRALARDLGRALDGCATLSRLVRLRVGRFAIEGALSSRALIPPGAGSVARTALLPIGCALVDLPRVDIDGAEARRFAGGNPFPSTVEGEVAVWSGDLLLGVGYGSDGVIRARKVLASALRAMEDVGGLCRRE